VPLSSKISRDVVIRAADEAKILVRVLPDGKVILRSLAGADIPVKLPVAVPRILVENIIWNTAMDWEHIHRCAPPSN